MPASGGGVKGSTLSEEDIICLDGIDALSQCTTERKFVSKVQPNSPEVDSTGNSKISRLLLQVVRLHLSEKCISPGCSAVREEAQKLGEKVEALEALSEKFRKQFDEKQSEFERLIEENNDLKKKISRMDALIRNQSVVIHNMEAQLNITKKRNHPGILQPVNNSSLQQLAIQHAAHAHNPANDSYSIPRPNEHDRLASVTGIKKSRTTEDAETFKTPSSATVANCLPLTTSLQKLLNGCSKNTRIRLDVPYVCGESLINFVAPISNPVLDYPTECLNSKYGSTIHLSVEVNTEPANFLLTRKVQGVVKYGAVNNIQPKSVKMFCYLESALKVLQWTSSMAYTFVDSNKMKFDVVFCKEQEIAAYDRVVVFAFALVGDDKFVTNRVVLNLGRQVQFTTNSGCQNGKIVRQQPDSNVIEKERMSTTANEKVITDSYLSHSNFEIYRP